MTNTSAPVSRADLPETWEARGRFGAGDDPDQHGEYVLTMHRADEESEVSELHVYWRPNRRISGLGTVDLAALAGAHELAELRDIAFQRAIEQAGPWTIFHGDRTDESRVAALVADADADARRALGHERKRGARIDNAFLKDVAQLYGEHGIDHVIETYDVTERTARRWLSIARERGLR
jgi:hypothetical protein